MLLNTFMKIPLTLDIDFRRNQYKGNYIAIEGIDGSGKSTQLHRLKSWFEENGKAVLLSSEPKDDLFTGELIRKILAAKSSIPQNAWQYLYSADRVINHETIIYPALKKGTNVLTHRSFWSVIPYGILDKTGVIYNYDVVNQLLVSQGILSYYHQFIVPDKTFFLDVSIGTIMKRLVNRSKEKEIYEKRAKLAKIAQGYEWLTQKFPNEFVVIDGEQSAEKVAEDIIREL